MITSREKVYQALFDLLGTAPGGFVTVSRRLQHWSDVTVQQQPAGFQQQVSEMATSPGRGVPNRWELHVNWWIYVNSGEDTSATPSSLINPLLDWMDGLFPSGSLPPQTLGLKGVSEARISGSVKTDEGLLGPQGVAIVPIRVVAV